MCNTRLARTFLAIVALPTATVRGAELTVVRIADETLVEEPASPPASEPLVVDQHGPLGTAFGQSAKRRQETDHSKHQRVDRKGPLGSHRLRVRLADVRLFARALILPACALLRRLVPLRLCHRICRVAALRIRIHG